VLWLIVAVFNGDIGAVFMTKIHLANERLNKQSAITFGVMRAVKRTNQQEKDIVVLNTGTDIQRFDAAVLGRNYVRTNKLYQVSYSVIEDAQGIIQCKIANISQPTLVQVAQFNGLGMNAVAEEKSFSSFWAEPIINIESIALFDTIAAVQKLLAECNEFIEPEQFCIAMPSCFCDFSGILNAVDNTAFNSQLEKDIAIAGAYLFCVYRSYFAVKNEGEDVSNFDHDILKFIERTIRNLAKENADLAEILRQFIRLSELSDTEIHSQFCASSILVKDFYDVLQPAKDRARNIWKQRYALGLEYY